ncbi:hypothetical protein AZL_a00530 (plasmid) [Azospirillum sp. B510]|nr:hypothetical protein AZL_a00530 [Azospirillum sp. B510]
MRSYGMLPPPELPEQLRPMEYRPPTDGDEPAVGLCVTIIVQVPLPDGLAPGTCQAKSLTLESGDGRYRLSPDGRLYRRQCRWETEDVVDPDTSPRMRPIDLGEEPHPYLAILTVVTDRAGLYSAAMFFGQLVGIRPSGEDVCLRDLDGLADRLWNRLFSMPSLDLPAQHPTNISNSARAERSVGCDG